MASTTTTTTTAATLTPATATLTTRLRAALLAPRTLAALAVALAGVALAWHKRLEDIEQRLGHWAVESWSAVPALIHTVVYVVRKAIQIAYRRLLGIPSAHVPKSWGFAEELSMSTLKFMGRIAHVSVPNVAIDAYAQMHRAMAKSVHGLTIQDVAPTRLGFGPRSSGELKFGPEVECSAVWITLNGEELGAQDVHTILYFHGGGFAFGHNQMYVPAFSKWLHLLRDRGVAAGVLSVKYPLAPKFKHPIPIDSCVHVYQHLVKHTHVLRPETVVVGGDSAGGLLALNVGLEATKHGAAGVLCFSPWVGQHFDTTSHAEYRDIDFVGGAATLAKFQEAYIDGGTLAAVADRKKLHLVGLRNASSVASLHVKSRLAEMPPVWLNAGSSEVFRDDVLHFAEILDEQGVRHEICVGQDGPHIYTLLFPLFRPESERALESAASFCVDAWREAKEETERLLRSAKLLDRLQ